NPVGVKQSAVNVPLMRLDIQLTIRSSNLVTIDNMTVNEIGSSKRDADVKQFKLWQDNGDGVFDALTDTVLSSSPVSNQLARFTALAMGINLGERRLLFVTADIDDFSQTNPPVTFGAQFDNFQSIVPLVPGSVQEKEPITGNVHFPMFSGAPTIVPKIITVSSTSVAASKVGINTPDFPVLQLRARTELGTGRLTRLTVNLEGTASVTAPADVGALKLYDDTDGDGAIDPGEALLATANWTVLATGVKEAVLAPLNIDLTTTPRPLLLAVDVLDAVIRRNFRLVLPDFNFIGVAGGDLENVNFPMASAFTTISSRLTFNGVNLATSNVNIGTNDFPVLSLFAQLDKTPPAPNNFEILDGFTVNLTGNASTTAPRDIGDLELYNDANGNGVIDGGDTQLATAPFVGGQATFTGLNLRITTTRRFFILALDVAAGAIVSRTFQLTIPDANALNAPAVIILTAPFPISSSVVTIVNTLTVVGTDLAAQTVALGTANFPVLALTLSTNGGAGTLNGFTVNLIGTATYPADVGDLLLINDADGDQVIDAGELPPLASAPFVSALGSVRATFSGLGLVATPTPRSLILALNIAANATAGRNFRLSITDASSFVTGAGTSVAPTTFPITSRQTDIGSALSVTGISRAESNVSLGTGNFPVLSVLMRMTQGSGQVNSLTVNLEGSAVVGGDVGEVKLYNDANGNGQVDNGEGMLASGTFTPVMGVMQATLTPGTPLNITTTTRSFLLTLDIAAGATVGRNFRLSITSPARVSAPGLTIDPTPFPISSDQTTIGRRLTVEGINRATTGVIPGVSNFPVLSLRVKIDKEATVTLSRLVATLSGTATVPNDVAAVKLLNDTDGDGAVDANESVLATGTIAGSQVTFDGLNVSVTTTPRSLLLIVDLASTAIAGRTFRLTLADANSVTSVQAVVVSPFPIASSEVTIGSVSGGVQGIPPVTFLPGLAMFSMPQDFGNIPADQIMQTTKIARYSPSLGRYELFPFSSPVGLQLGRGYFASFDRQVTINAQGTLAPTTARFPIPVVRDWNLIGYPYPPLEAFANGINWNDPSNVERTTLVQYTDPVLGDQTVTMQEAVNRNVMRPVLFTLNAARNGYTMTTVMEPYRAYWTRCLVNTAVLHLSRLPIQLPSFPFNPSRAKAPSARRDPLSALLGNNFRDGWSIQLIARAGQAEDASNYVGVSTGVGHTGQMGVEKPPALLNVAPTVDLALMQENAPRLAIDLRAPNREQYTWEFVVTTNQPNVPVSITP
ncbi:MAG: hypothetical protein RMK49_17815, partial [Abditibacteriales bacterium]|nr:hypothetical protein [Abditibacteriales bacterium]